MLKVFIDGSAGTTGLRIAERLGKRRDVSIIALPDEKRKDAYARAEALDAADIAFLCLPDAAAIEAVSLVQDPDTVVIDASTAHRVDPNWAYGFPELAGAREAIACSKRIANPGCHASGFIALVAPLVQAGLLPVDVQLSAFSLTGYSGGGKVMIAEYDMPNRSDELLGGQAYALGQGHKHLPEMQAVCGLLSAPVFCPVVEPLYSGMQVTVPLHASQICGNAAQTNSGSAKSQVASVLRDYYADAKLVRFVAEEDLPARLGAGSMQGRDDMKVCVCGNDERMTLVATFDNLGKGASGAAIQNMNIVMGLPEETGLVLE